MYEVERYTSVNNLGTAVLMDRLVRRPVERLVVASSMSVYGEGLYRDQAGLAREVPSRSLDQLRRSEWEPRVDGVQVTPVPTPESKSVKLESVYALSKYDQERMCLVLGRAYGIPTVSLRLFNVYGTRQSLSNPYTGVLAIFASRLLNGRRPLVYEDGEQRRDFVSVHDVARACRLALDSGAAPGAVLNIGSGESRTISQIAWTMAKLLGVPHLQPEVTGRYRMGDVRHCYADIRRAEQVLDYRALMDFDSGLAELARWLDRQVGKASDRALEARAELEKRGLTL
jgi:dTDP-L-rhamnose 4-epimerase